MVTDVITDPIQLLMLSYQDLNVSKDDSKSHQSIYLITAIITWILLKHSDEKEAGRSGI